MMLLVILALLAIVSFGVGFTDTSHFTRSFKRRYGTGPREYRRNHPPPA